MARKTYFDEPLCAVGGCRCPAWEEWFMACDDTDPKAIDEGRDPKPLEQWPFNPLGCERPDVCRLYAKAGGREAAETEITEEQES
jgi:hypothetical protein